MAKKGLCIGINNYPGTKMALKGCVNDATDWSKALATFDFDTQLLLDEEATKANIIEAISSLIEQSKEADSLVITFAGHGTYVVDSNGDEVDGLDEALCPYDIHSNQNALTDDEIRTLFDARKQGVSLLLISDSCHSGTVTRAAPSDDDEIRPRFMPVANWTSKDKLPEALSRGVRKKLVSGASVFKAGLNKDEGDLLLSGCEEGVYNYSYDGVINNRPCGAFTHYALKTLKKMKADATYADWHRAYSRYLPSSKYPQSPQIMGNKKARLRKIFT